jgi:CheY-like chemotaxis protein
MRSHLTHIFLAEDDNDEIVFFKNILEKISLEIRLTIFSNGEELINRVKEEHLEPDIIFIDLDMPKVNGLETIKRLNDLKLLPNTPKIIYTLVKNDFVATKALEKGAWAYLIKPFDIDDLQPRIERLLSLDWSNYKRPENLEDFVIS